MRRAILFVLIVCLSVAASAIPAKRGQWTTLTLADGSRVKALLVGDEHLHYWQDEQGRQYVFDEATNRHIATDMSTLKARTAIRRARAANHRQRRMAQRRIGNYGDYTGQKKGLIILVEYTDVHFQPTHTLELYKQIANEENFSNDMGFCGSVHDYFKAQSQGQFDLTFDVYGPVPLANNRSYYGNNDDQGNDQHPEEMVIEACTALGNELDLSQYDWDGDGEVDQVFLLYAGKGEANGGSRDTVWPHEWTLEEAGQELTLNGYRINTYGCSCELQPSGIDGIGTICHEFSHCLGYPDMYDINYGGHYGMDNWDVMSHGSYNGRGFIPAGYTSYEKMAAGWLAPIELKGTMAVNGLKALSEGGNSYIIYNKGHNDEYYLVENRQPTQWDRAIGGSGLLILHVDYKPELWAANIVNSTGSFGEDYGFNPPVYNNHEMCTVFHAGSYDDVFSPSTDTYPFEGNDSLTNYSKPIAKLYNKNTDGMYYMNIRLSEMKITDGKASFRFTDNVPSVISEQQELTDTLFYESFNQCAGKGGNDGLWSGNIATGAFTPDNPWTQNKAYGANQCARVGNTSAAGYLVTPEIDIQGTALVKFLAAPWNIDENFMYVMPDDGYEAEFSESVFDLMTPHQWTEHTLTLNGNGPLKLLFYSNRYRFFIDEIVVIGASGQTPVIPDDPDKPQPIDGFLPLGMATFTDGSLCEIYTDNYGNLFNPVTYEVEIQESASTPGLFRLMNPYGTAYPYYEEEKYYNEQDWHIDIHAENPQAVYIDRQPTGWKEGGPTDIQSVGAYWLQNGYDLQQAIDEGVMGTLVDGVIIFPKSGIYIYLQDNDAPRPVNRSGSTMIILPASYQKPTSIGLIEPSTTVSATQEGVYDLQGRLIGYHTPHSATNDHWLMNQGSCKKGIYLVRSANSGQQGTQTRKIIIR